MAINRNSEEFNFGSYGNADVNSGVSNFGAQQMQSQQQESQDFKSLERQSEDEENQAKKDSQNKDDEDKDKDSNDNEGKDSKEEDSEESSKGDSDKSSGQAHSEGDGADNVEVVPKKSKIKDKSTKDKENQSIGGENGEGENVSLPLPGSQKSDLKDKAGKAVIAGQAAVVGAKVGVAATVVNAIKNLIQLIIAIIKNLINAVVGFISSVASAIAGAFVGAASAIATGLAVSTMAATFLLAGIIAIVPVAATVAAYQYAQDLNTRRVDGDCEGRRFKQGQDDSVEKQGLELAAYAREAAEMGGPYKHQKPKADAESVKDGYQCDEFVSHCFMHEESELVTDMTPCASWYLDFDDYVVDTNKKGDIMPESEMKPGDVICFDEDFDEETGRSTASRPCEHVAIYVGDGIIAHSNGGKGIHLRDFNYNEETGKSYSSKFVVKVVRPYKAKDNTFEDDDSSGGGGGAASSAAEFYKEHKEAIVDGWVKYHLYPSVTLVQCQLESSFGTAGQNRDGYSGALNNATFTRGGTVTPYWSLKKKSSDGFRAYKDLDEHINDRNYWLGTMGLYKKVRQASSADLQWKALAESQWCEGGYNSTWRKIRKSYEKYDKDLPESKYDPDKEDISIFDEGIASINDDISTLNSDDGCGGQVKDNSDEWGGVPGSMVSDENATWIAYDEKKLESQIGSQAPMACGTWAQAYATFIISGGKKHTSLSSIAMQHIAGANYRWSGQHVSWETRAGTIWKEVVENKRPVVVAGQGTSFNHYTTVIGVRKGVTKETVKPTDWVILDPASSAQNRRNFYGSHPWMHGYNFNGSSYGHQTVTYEGYK